MNKVLIIGTIWPYHNFGGARVPGLAKYLREFDWEPVVLTMPLSRKPNLDCSIIEVPFSDILNFLVKRMATNPGESAEKQLARKVGLTAQNPISQFMFRRLREIVTYPDLNMGWKTPAIRTGEKIIEKEGIKAIVSASPPILTNIIAHKLKDRYKIPWLGDFPHIWSQNTSSYPYNTFSSIRIAMDRRLELKTLSTADVLTTTSEPLADKIRALHRDKMVYAITHGFDPDILNLPPAELTEHFTISYTGSFAPVLREPEMLLAALQKLITDNIIDRNRVEVRFYGSNEEWIDHQIEKYDMVGIAKQYGRIPMPLAQAKQRESQILLNPKCNDPQEAGIHSMKIFEYLAARRQILATGPYPDVVDDLLAETGAGICTRTVEETAQALEMMYREYLAKGEVAWRGNDAKIGAYSHRAMAGKFAEILNRLTAR